MFRNLFALIGLAFVLFLGVGYVMKWYTYSRTDGKLTFLIFTDKVEEGLQNFKDSAVNALSKKEDDKAKPEPASFGGFFTPTPKPTQPTGRPIADTPMPNGGR